MHLINLLLLAFPSLTIAGPRFHVLTGTCSIGVEGGEWDAQQITVEGRSACGGCLMFGSPWEDFETGDPCFSCQGKLVYKHNGDWLNFYHEDGRQAGVCQPLRGQNDYCATWQYTCSYTQDWVCEFWDANYPCH